VLLSQILFDYFGGTIAAGVIVLIYNDSSALIMAAFSRALAWLLASASNATITLPLMKGYFIFYAQDLYYMR